MEDKGRGPARDRGGSSSSSNSSNHHEKPTKSHREGRPRDHDTFGPSGMKNPFNSSGSHGYGRGGFEDRDGSRHGSSGYDGGRDANVHRRGYDSRDGNVYGRHGRQDGRDGNGYGRGGYDDRDAHLYGRGGYDARDGNGNGRGGYSGRDRYRGNARGQGDEAERGAYDPTRNTYGSSRDDSERGPRRGGERSPGETESQTSNGSDRSHKRPTSETGQSKHRRTDAGSSAAGPSMFRAEKYQQVQDSDRPKKDRYEIVRSKPDSFITKNGTSGQELSLIGNFFRLMKRTNWELVQYRVDFNPECDATSKTKHMIYKQRELLGGYLYDTKNTVYLTRKLPQDTTVVDTKDREGNDYQVTFKFTNITPMDTRESLQVLNLILRRAMDGLNLQLVGRNLFDAAASIDIHNFQLQVWPGYTTSIRQHESDVLLCVEIASKVMRKETVYDLLVQTSRDSRGGDFKQMFSNQVIGMTVLTDYNNKTYFIHDVSYDSSPSDEFETSKGTKTTFIEYYKTKYGKIIRNLTQPMLITKSKEKALRGGAASLVALVPELCRPTGLSDRQRNNFQLMKSLSEFTRMDPRTRQRKLVDFNNRLNTTPASVDMLRSWHFELDRNLIKIPGRVLKNENIVFGNGKEPSSERSSDWQFRNKSMYKQYKLERWIVLVPHQMGYQANSFIQNLMKIARDMEFELQRPNIISLHDDRNHSYQTKFEEAARTDPQLIMAFVPNNNADRYAAIKKMGCVNFGIPTQVMVQKTLNNKGILSIATKVLLQLNCKLGGLPWLIEMPTRGLMTVGIDVSRDNRDKKILWGGLVATMDLKNTAAGESFFSTVTKHTKCEEFSFQLTLNMVKALKCYQEQNNGALPEKICLYRDGVGDGQLKYVYEYEVKQVKEALEELYEKHDLKLKFAFIIVSKKINARLFAKQDNPPPGTVVDDVITLPERYDFYLVSQSVRQGTVSPTSYNVVYDSLKFPPDRLQILTYKQTHLYYNWTGTVRVPAVCQYAHKLTFLVAQCLHDIPTCSLEKKLYFL